MTESALKLVDPADLDRCGAQTMDGSPCKRETGGDPCWQHEDSPDAGAVEPPDHLEEAGREEWNRRTRELASAGLLEYADLGLLESACEMYQHARRCQRVIAAKGEVVQGRKGVKKNPAMSYHTKYRKEYRMCIGELRKSLEGRSPKIEGDDDPFDF